MKIVRRMGLSYYTINLNAEETEKYKATRPRSVERRRVIQDAWDRNQFGSTENAVKALMALDRDLCKVDKLFSQN